jgi:phosphoribosylamine--glycine ligase / phosphoribosylformylglycinamidine cyclo-ligase
MGAYAPAPVATPAIMEQIVRETLKPTIDGMRREGPLLSLQSSLLFGNLKRLFDLGYPFVGLLFTGFILTDSGPKVLEYNVRFGDPETQALMLLLSGDTDLAAIILVRTPYQ